MGMKKKKNSSPKNVSECEARDVNVTRVSVLKVHLQWNSSLAHDASWKSSKKITGNRTAKGLDFE